MNEPVIEVRDSGRTANVFFKGHVWKRTYDPNAGHSCPRWEKIDLGTDVPVHVPVRREAYRVLEQVYRRKISLGKIGEIQRFPRLLPRSLATVKNARFWVRPGTLDERILREVLTSNLYLRLLPSREHDVWLDIGANIGAFAVKVSPFCRKVVCFEREPDNFELLVQNLNLNRCGNATALPLAVSGKRDGKRTLYLNQRKNKGAHSFHVKRGRRPILVPTREIGSLLDEFRPTKIKIDCEGTEHAATPSRPA